MKRMISIAAGLIAGAFTLGAVPASAQTSTAPDCTSSNLTASWHATDAGMGHYYGQLRLTNKGSRTCHIYGYGGLSFVGGGTGTQLGAAADRAGDPARGFDLAPGQTAASDVQVAQAGNYSASDCRPKAADGFRVYPPDETHSLYVHKSATGCANTHVHLLQIHPYRKL